MIATANHDTDFAANPSVRIELVDNFHKDWEKVCAHLERLGQRAALMTDHDGWLSARQSVLVAFVGDQPAGHVCFRVEPAPRPGHPRPALQARVDAVAVTPDTDHPVALERMLRKSAADRARELNCHELVGFTPR